MTISNFIIEKYPFSLLLFIVPAIILFAFIGITILLHYEGYYCQTIIHEENLITLNAWCGHNGKIITNSTGSYWHIEGWNFGDYP